MPKTSKEKTATYTQPNPRTKRLRKDTKPSPTPSARLRSQIRSKNVKLKNINGQKNCVNCTACQPKCKSPNVNGGGSAPKVTKGKGEEGTPKVTRGRGRPKKNKVESKKNVDTNESPQDLRSLLMEIKGEVNDVNEQISDVKKTQELSTNGFSNIMNVKMNEVKESIEVKISDVKEDMGKNEALLTKMQVSQSLLEGKLDTLNNLKNNVVKNSDILSNLQEAQKNNNCQFETVNQKLVDLNDKSCDIEVDILRQKRYVDETNQDLSKKLYDVEYGLAAHIEVIKENMEAEVAGTKKEPNSSRK